MERFIQIYGEIIFHKARSIKLISRLTKIDISMDQRDGCNRLPAAKHKLQQANIRQKAKSNVGSYRNDFNLHIAMISALAALNGAENKTGTQPVG